MTSLLSPLAAAPSEGAPDGPPRRAGGREIIASATLVVALFVWAGPVTYGSGGRSPWVVGLGLLSLLPALVVLRPWRTLPSWHVLVAMSPAVAALAVCLTAPTAFDGLDETAAFAYCGALYLVVRCWAVDDLRRRLLLVVVALVGLEQFAKAWVAWWGSQSVATMMSGTFYWHNQFAAFMLGTGLVAGVLAVRSSGPLRRAGWAIAPFCFAGLLFAGSRAGLGVFALMWAVVVVLSFLDRRGRVASLALLAVTLGVATLLSSPLLMQDSGSFGATVQAREADASAEGSGGARLTFWRAAAELGMSRPVTGGGFDSFGTAGSARLPATSGEASLSIYAHNGYLQAFSDGGMVLALALVAATGLPLVAGVRLLYRRGRNDDVLAVAVPVALLGLVLHSGVDFDWAYPSLLALFALLAALVPAARRDATPGSRSTAPLAAVVLVLVVAAVPGALRASALRAPTDDVPFWGRPIDAVLPLHGQLDLLPSASMCRDELSSPDREVREHGLACSVPAAQDDPGLQLLRAGADVQNGHVQRGVRLADQVVAEHAQRRPMMRALHAEVLQLAGQDAAAKAELVALHARLTDLGLTADTLQVQAIIDSETP
jgi:hypothetical protein